MTEVTMHRSGFVAPGGQVGAAGREGEIYGSLTAALSELARGGGNEAVTAEISISGRSVVLGPDAVNVLLALVNALAKDSSVTIRIGGIPDMLSPEQVGRELGVSRPFVYKLLDSGDLPFQKVGAHRRIPAAAVAEYLEAARGRVVAADDTALAALDPGAAARGSSTDLRAAARAARQSGDPTVLREALRARRAMRVARSLPSADGGQ